MSKGLFSFLLTGLLVLMAGYTSAQLTAEEDLQGKNGSRIISTAVPFLTISPDSRASAMGETGVATSPDANATFWNPGKVAFIENPKGQPDYSMGLSLSYTPWLRKLINDMSISYLSGYKKLSQEEAIAFSLLFFDLGSMTFRDNQNNPLGEHNPREYSFSGMYSRKLSQNLGLGLGLKFIHSNLTGNTAIQGTGQQTKPGNTAAADIGLYYNNEANAFANKLGLLGGSYSWGASISNIGAKVSYTTPDEADFIPTTFRLGGAATAEVDPYNKFTLAVDFSKLLVPTPPVYERDENGQIVENSNGEAVIQSGSDPDRSFLAGMFGSFGDAPGGLSEELKEVMIAVGVEYWYYDAFAVRAGYFHENQIKGNRKYFTAGIGVNYKLYGLDFSYLIPTSVANPLQDTIRFTLKINFESQSPVEEESITE